MFRGDAGGEVAGARGGRDIEHDVARDTEHDVDRDADFMPLSQPTFS